MIQKAMQYEGKPAVWPLPNRSLWQDGSLRLSEPLTLHSDCLFAAEAELFRQSLAEHGIAVQPGDDGAVIHAELVPGAGLGPEGYRLTVTPAGIALAAGTAAGMFYAFQTLEQLIINSPGGQIPAVEIEDSPFKAIRGMHFYVPPRQSLSWFKRFLDFAARFKFNTIFLEIGASMKFDSHPEINEAWEKFCREMLAYPGGPDSNHFGDSGMQMTTGNIKNSVHIENGGGSYLEKDEMAEIAAWCRERHIEIIPEVQGLSHVYWMLLAHPECAERHDDPYPDTWCSSNPRSYEIYFDCLQEIVDVLKPRTVSLGHDEYQWVGVCDKCIGITGHDIFAEDILKAYHWLAERGIRTHVWGDKFYNLVKKDELEIGMGSGGGKHLNFNLRTGGNDLVKPTFRSLDRMPADLLISDWYYGSSLTTQEMFGDRGLSMLFGNFHPGSFPDMAARLRRPNVLGAEVSLWHETSDQGMAMVDNYAKFLDAINYLWFKDYDFRRRDRYCALVAQLYPAQRDRMNGVVPPSFAGMPRPVDLSGCYNSPLVHGFDYGFMAKAESLPGALPFALCQGVEDRECDPACLAVGGGNPESASFPVGGHFRSLAFLHSYTARLFGPPAHACTYVGWEEDIVGSYEVEYGDGSVQAVPLEYSRDIYTTGTGYAFGAQRSNPAFQRRVLREVVEQAGAAKEVVLKETWSTVFAYEWLNPCPEKPIARVTVRHEPGQKGALVLLAVTGVE